MRIVFALCLLATPALALEPSEAAKAVGFNLVLTRSCDAERYASAKQEAQSLLDAAGYTSHSAQQMIADIEAMPAQPQDAKYCTNMIRHMDGILAKLR